MPGPRVALDVMGGDRGSAELIDGAVRAARDDGAEVTLVGRGDEIESVLSRLRVPAGSIEIVHAPDVVAMGESPLTAIRAKPLSSIVVGIDLVRSGAAAGFVSTGNSGAVMAAAVFRLGRIRGVERPALATVFPTLHGHCLLIDVGANVDSKADHLLQFAVMGATYLERVFDRPTPRVGILSNGEEEGKGNALVREAFDLLRASRLTFVGNVEGKDIPHHLADVVVMDGFTGNVVLKVGEGISTFVSDLIRQEAKRTLMGILGGLLMKPTFRRVRRRVDYEEYGGAPLLGVNGVCIIAHGRSNAHAIRNAIRVARHAAERGLNECIREGIESHTALAVAGDPASP